MPQVIALMKRDFCRSQVYKLVQGLHCIGIVHGDLKPRNIARAHGGVFLSIFPRVGGISARRVRYATRPLHSLGCLHVNKVSELGTHAAPTPYQMCYELRKCLEE